MSAAEVRELARLVIDASADFPVGAGKLVDSLRELARVWALSREGRLGHTEEAAVVRAMYFARAWSAVNRGDDVIPWDPFPFEHPARQPGGVRSSLRWRPGYGWRRDGDPDGDPLTPVSGPPDEWYEAKPRVNRACPDPDFAYPPLSPAAQDALDQLVAMSSAPSIYAGRVARAGDSHEVRLLLDQVEGVMRSLERGGPKP